MVEEIMHYEDLSRFKRLLQVCQAEAGWL